MFASRSHRLLTVFAFAAVALSAAASSANADDVKLPQTAAEYDARAQQYEQEAAQYRQAAQEHKQMAADYAAQRPDIKGVGKNTAVAKMSEHCNTLAKDYQKLANDAEDAAKFNRMHAKELEGK